MASRLETSANGRCFVFIHFLMTDVQRVDVPLSNIKAFADVVAEQSNDGNGR